MKSKFGLAAYFRPGKQDLHNAISVTLRKYFALPLIKSEQIRGQVEQLEIELKSIAAGCTPEVAKKLNRFHNYVVEFWMKLQGGGSISVVGCPHKTNNVMER